MKRLLIILLISITNVSYGQWVEQNVNFEQLSQINSVTLNENSEVKPVKNYKKGEPIELYDLVYMFVPDEGEDFTCPTETNYKVVANGKSFKESWEVF